MAGTTGTAAWRGRLAEQAAAAHLEKQGYEIRARNYLAPRLGELDLIVQRGNVLTIVEVKARCRAEAFGGLPATITARKLERMRKATWCYVKEMHLMNMDISFLAALVALNSAGQVLDISIVPVEWS